MRIAPRKEAGFQLTQFLIVKFDVGIGDKIHSILEVLRHGTALVLGGHALIDDIARHIPNIEWVDDDRIFLRCSLTRGV